MARLFFLVLALLMAAWLINPRALRAQARVPIPIYRVETGQRAMALTINVVWGTSYVPQLLSTLKALHVPATFMVGGVWAKANPRLIKEMIADGDQVGNHGWNHQHPNQLSFEENIKDIEDTNRTVQQIAGIRPTVYAPPYGEFNSTVLNAAHQDGMNLVMWTIDTIDWRPSSSVSYMVSKVLQKAAPGAIVLMHPTDRTVKALSPIITGLQHGGYRLVTVNKLLTLGTPRTDS